MALDGTYSLIADIKDKLFAAEKRRLTTEIDRLCERHSELTDTNSMEGFIFNGETYRHSHSSIVWPRYRMLAWTLNGEMEQWVRDSKQIQMDQDLIGQILFKLLYQANDMQEVRDTLPECLIPLVPELAAMSRQCNQEFLIQHNERDLKQFRKILPKIEMYAMTRLIY